MTTIKLKNGSGAPLAGDLVQGEPALDLTNKRLYTEDSGGTVIEVGTNPGTDVTFADNRKAIFGAGSDLQIYHDGTHSKIEDAGSGDLKFITDGSGFNFQKGSSETLANFAIDGAVTLYHNNATKLATTSTGIDVTGSVVSDGLTSDGNVSVVGVANTRTIGFDFYGFSKYNFHVDGSTDADKMFVRRGTTNVADFASNGDISFYEDTGTTAKLFWDASAESLGIGTSSPARELEVVGAAHFGEPSSGVTLSDNGGVGSVYGLNAAGTAYNPVEIRTGLSGSGFYQATGGNVGIGTSSPALKLSVDGDIWQGNAGGVEIGRITNNAGWYDFGGSANVNGAQMSHVVTVRFLTNSAERMRIDSSGNVGIGTNDPITTLTLGTGTTGISFKSSSAVLNSGKIAVIKPIEAGTGNGHLVFETYQGGSGGGERMRITSGGVFLIGATAADGLGGAPGDINNAEIGKGYINLNRDDTTTARQIQFGKNGVVAGYIETGSSTTSYVTSSDARLKDNIVDAPSASDDIDAIQVRSFDWKADGSHQKYGMVAQELQSVAPEAVSGDADSDDMMGVDYSKLVPMLVKEIQSLRARVAQLEGAN